MIALREYYEPTTPRVPVILPEALKEEAILYGVAQSMQPISDLWPIDLPEPEEPPMQTPTERRINEELARYRKAPQRESNCDMPCQGEFPIFAGALIGLVLVYLLIAGDVLEWLGL